MGAPTYSHQVSSTGAGCAAGMWAAPVGLWHLPPTQWDSQLPPRDWPVQGICTVGVRGAGSRKRLLLVRLSEAASRRGPVEAGALAHGPGWDWSPPFCLKLLPPWPWPSAALLNASWDLPSTTQALSCIVRRFLECQPPGSRGGFLPKCVLQAGVASGEAV